jgi:hypothetical protein
MQVVAYGSHDILMSELMALDADEYINPHNLVCAITFDHTMIYDTCSICMEDFVFG